MTPLPIPSPEAQKHSQQLSELIQQKIIDGNGWIDFAEFMHMALYAPRLGYYSAGNQKFGKGGDFVTAPEISSLFGQTLANQVAKVLQITHGDILELGAGTGKLAADILLTLAKLDCLPARYYILEVSDHLRQVQLEYLKKHLSDDLSQLVVWLNELPEKFTGIVIGNEVLDAIPVHVIHTNDQKIYRRGVTVTQQGFAWLDKSLIQPALLNRVIKLDLPDGYLTEICPAAYGLIHSLADMLESGAIVMIDYGFSAHEYYHPQRNQGTLMCHYQQLAHTDPLVYVGLQDITAHVDFTAIAESGINKGLQLAGFCTQAQFLMNCGILDSMSQISPNDIANYAPLAAAAQKLLSPAEMGDLFKVIGFSKNIEKPLLGFTNGDKSHTL
ncbi:MAG TPA: SAM-dependent methyltransferase [Methylotenera sp.]|nr:SAM-dependent methyltransferase [Methylotenera sp.]